MKRLHIRIRILLWIPCIPFVCLIAFGKVLVDVACEAYKGLRWDLRILGGEIVETHREVRKQWNEHPWGRP